MILPGAISSYVFRLCTYGSYCPYYYYPITSRAFSTSPAQCWSKPATQISNSENPTPRKNECRICWQEFEGSWLDQHCPAILVDLASLWESQPKNSSCIAALRARLSIVNSLLPGSRAPSSSKLYSCTYNIDDGCGLFV